MTLSIKEIVFSKVEELKQNWNRLKTRSNSKINIAVSFMVDSLDQLIDFVEEKVSDKAAGKFKKESVLLGLSHLYDTIVPSLLPFYLKPFSGVIKIFLVYVILSYLIDFIVNKNNQKIKMQSHNSFIKIEELYNAIKDENESIKKQLEVQFEETLSSLRNENVKLRQELEKLSHDER